MPDSRIYQLKVTLLDTNPLIWRRIRVPAGIILRRLSEVVKTAMGWGGGHLHEFRVRGDYYGPILPGNMDDSYPTRSDTKVRLCQVLPQKGSSLIYTYDMGDNWQHRVYLERILPRDPKVRVPVCLDGARACPPEDCGSTSGYERLLTILGNPRHPEHKGMKRWLKDCGYEPYDPEALDLTAVNDQMRSIR